MREEISIAIGFAAALALIVGADVSGGIGFTEGFVGLVVLAVCFALLVNGLLRLVQRAEQPVRQFGKRLCSDTYAIEKAILGCVIAIVVIPVSAIVLLP